MRTFSRRGFLTRAALAGGALVLPTSGLLTSVGCLPRGLTRRTDHYFVFYYMMGGWDLVLTTDPVPAKGDTIWIPYKEDDVVETGGHKFGPAFEPLLPFVDRMAILRGIYVDALNHPQARIRMCTGTFKPPGPRPTAPSVQSIIAEKIGLDYEIPNISSDSLRPATFRGEGQPERLEPMRVASVNQLKGLMHWRGPAGKHRKDIEETLRRKDALLREAHAHDELAKEFDTYAELARGTLDSDYARRVSNLSVGSTRNRTEANAQLAVEAIRNDLAPVITVGSGEFDSHTAAQYAGHPASVLRGVKTVAAIAQGLDDTPMPGGKTLLDHTTIVVSSEFSRAPSKNELGGKHHWSANSMIFIGKGIKAQKGGPTIAGECDDGVNPQKMNPENGSFKRGTELIEMQHGLATVLTLAGIDPFPHFGPYEPVTPLLG